MGLVKCLCQDDLFSGDLCDIPANLCNQMPCHNGGQCLQFPTNYTCQCPSLFKASIVRITQMCVPVRTLSPQFHLC
uniref:EGF-like domain-containing protein n=1 Tax=Ditylenchus dipsaci TaxID=166011 RepID=A0A915E3L4_9BILA